MLAALIFVKKITTLANENTDGKNNCMYLCTRAHKPIYFKMGSYISQASLKLIMYWECNTIESNPRLGAR